MSGRLHRRATMARSIVAGRPGRLTSGTNAARCFHPARRSMIEVHGQQLAALMERLVNQPPRHLQVVVGQLTACIVASHLRFELIFMAQQQKAALGPGDGERRVHHG